MRKSTKVQPVAEVSVLNPEINAREIVRHVACNRSAHLVQLNFSCVSAAAATELFFQFSRAVQNETMSIALPAKPGAAT